MGAILDILGSLALRAVIAALVINLIILLRDTQYERTSQATTTQNLATAIRIIERDLNYAGYNTVTTPFLIATSQEVKFISDLDNSPVTLVDTVDFRIAADPSGEANSKVILRVQNNQLPLYIAKGQLTLNFQYYDSLSAVTGTLSKIKSVSVSLSLKNTYTPNDTTFSTIKKEQRVFPANL